MKLIALWKTSRFSQSSLKVEVERLVNVLSDHQTLAFSATFSQKSISALSVLMRQPQLVMLDNEKPVLLGVQRFYQNIDCKEKGPLRRLRVFEAKVEAVVRLLSGTPFHQAVIFVDTRSEAHELALALQERHWLVAMLSGSMPQAGRDAAMHAFYNLQLRVLVTTDVAARGVDFPRVNLVISLQPSKSVDTYHHRTGRTGRYGTHGVAVTLVADEDEEALAALQKHVELQKLDDVSQISPESLRNYEFTPEEQTALEELKEHEQKDLGRHDSELPPARTEQDRLDALNKPVPYFVAEKSKPKEKWRIGQHCWARWNVDGIWYRAEILAYDPGMSAYQVAFTEYGNIEWVHKTALHRSNPYEDKSFVDPYASEVLPLQGEEPDQLGLLAEEELEVAAKGTSSEDSAPEPQLRSKEAREQYVREQAKLAKAQDRLQRARAKAEKKARGRGGYPDSPWPPLSPPPPLPGTFCPTCLRPHHLAPTQSYHPAAYVNPYLNPYLGPYPPGGYVMPQPPYATPRLPYAPSAYGTYLPTNYNPLVHRPVFSRW